ncbi:LRR receptor-like serine/threonine-protein kinase GSO2 [Selaginella moellendorffii]|nr:LRR receptor-like serine/threonine-protein kinase GSO2 [Selaginella moellendorffii]|eukprot:XP_002984595.2 LRR receptor-like serine/threonine-protein kinase GSO2 [Selaginella moellendorffii]
MSRTSMSFLVVLTVSLLAHHTTAASCNSEDEKALLAFKDADQDRSKLLTTWSPQSSCCEWSGIKCDGASGRVSELKLESLGLTGTLSPELGSLSHLRTLNVHGNSMDGPIPSTFGKLLRLEVLDLGTNFFSGALPASLAQLASTLQTLDLSGYRFEGPFPSVIGKLTSLRKLILERADASAGSIPSFLASLENLTILNLQGSWFTGSIPSSLSKLKNLQTLDLSDGLRLTGSIPAFLGGLQNLEYLDLSGTKFSGSIPPSLGNLPKLRFLDISNTLVSSSIPVEIGKLTSLETLRISGTKAAGRIPDTLGNLKKLKVLELSQNAGMRGPIPSSFGQLSSLEELSVSSTGLTGQIPSSLGQLSRLVKLDVTSNSLSGSIPESLGLLSSLEVFWASENLLSGRVPEGFARGLKNLTVLQLSMNNLTGLPTNMAKLVNLNAVYLDNNDIRSFDAISGLATLPELSTISLSRCKLQGPIPSWFANLNLKQQPLGSSCLIDLSFNSITGTIPAALGRNSNLTNLFLQSNKLQGKLPDSFGKTLPRLTYSDFSSNFLTGVPADLSNLGKGVLYSLGLEHNNLSFQALEGLTTLSQVSFLTLDHSHLTGAIPSWFSKIRMIQDDSDSVAVLRLSSNIITGRIPPELGQLTQVTGLYLDDNAIAGEIPRSLANLTSLQRMNLAQNRLTGKIPVEFLALKRLRYLNVSHNQLTGAIPDGAPLSTMDPENFAGNPGLCGKPLSPCPTKP